jgi:hypothetical protein
MTARIQVTMEPEEYRRARAKAEALGISFAEYVRRVVSRDLGEARLKPDISMVFDLGASREPTDVARDKHKMLDEAVWEEYLRKTGQSEEKPGRTATSRR